jgi:hypothetical protein
MISLAENPANVAAFLRLKGRLEPAFKKKVKRFRVLGLGFRAKGRRR